MLTRAAASSSLLCTNRAQLLAICTKRRGDLETLAEVGHDAALALLLRFASSPSGAGASASVASAARSPRRLVEVAPPLRKLRDKPTRQRSAVIDVAAMITSAY